MAQSYNVVKEFGGIKSRSTPFQITGLFDVDINSTAGVVNIGNSSATTTVGNTDPGTTITLNTDPAGAGVTINGDLTVIGTQTAVESVTTLVNDNILVLHNDVGVAGNDSGLLIERHGADVTAGVAPDLFAEDSAGHGGASSAATASDITLNAGASGVAGFYDGWYIKITSGASSGDIHKITGYASPTVASIAPATWSGAAPAADSYELYNRSYVGMIYDETLDEMVIGAAAADPGLGTVTVTGFVDLHMGGLTLEGPLVIDVDASEALLVRKNADGGDIFTVDTIGEVVAVGGVGALSSLKISSTPAGAIDIGADASARAITIGNAASASLALEAGVGAMDLDADGALSLNSSGAAINVGNDADAFPVNIGTGAAARVITIGNAASASLALEAGVGAMDLDADGALSLNSTGGALNVGDDADAFPINIGTGAAARTISIGNATGATALDIDAGTAGVAVDSTGVITLGAAGDIVLNSSGGGLKVGDAADTGAIDIGTGAAARTVTIGNTDTTTAVVINAGTGATTVNNGLVVTSAAAAAIAGATTLSADDSGGIFSVAKTSSYEITLPTPAQGLSFKFMVLDVGAFAVTLTNSSAHLFGIANVAGTNTALTGTTLTLAATGDIGDWVQVEGIDATHYLVTGACITAAKITIA